MSKLFRPSVSPAISDFQESARGLVAGDLLGKVVPYLQMLIDFFNFLDGKLTLSQFLFNAGAIWKEVQRLWKFWKGDAQSIDVVIEAISIADIEQRLERYRQFALKSLTILKALIEKVGEEPKWYWGILFNVRFIVDSIRQLFDAAKPASSYTYAQGE